MIIRVEASLTVAVPKGKGNRDYAKQTVFIEMDHVDILAMITDGRLLTSRNPNASTNSASIIEKDGIEEAIKIAQEIAADRVWEAILDDIDTLTDKK